MFVAFLIAFVALSALAAIAIGSAYSYSQDRIRSEIYNKELLLADVQRSLIANALEEPLTFIKMVPNSPYIQNYGQETNADTDQLEAYLHTYISDTALFDHVHLVDEDGKQIFVLEAHLEAEAAENIDPALTGEETDVINNIMTTPPGSIYISIFNHDTMTDKTKELNDLSIHLGMPVYNHDGQLVGGLLFSYPFHKVSQSFILDSGAKTMIGYILLMDEDSNYIFNERATTLDIDASTSFKNDFPAEWSSIVKDQHGQLDTDNGVFTFHTIDLNENIPGNIIYGPDQKIVLVTYMDADKIAISWGSFDRIYTNILIFLCIAIPMLAYMLALIYSLITFSRDLHKHRAQHDTLTGLANRKRFLDVTQQALDGLLITKTNLAIAYFDLDNFKQINDTMGHDVGDEVLKQVAKNTRAALRQHDLVARIGGDEFVVLITEIKDEAEISAVAERIQRAIQTPIELKHGSLTVQSSMGVWIVTEPNCELNDVLAKADEAMYRAKNEGKNRVVIGNVAG